MSGRIEVDTARLPLLLTELRLPAIGRLWAEMAERSDREGWPAARFLSTIAELEIAERARRRIERHLLDARLPPDKTLDGFDFAHVPMLSRARVTALASGDAWLNRGKNLLLFGPPGSGKTHISAAIGRALVENGYRVLFTRTTELVQRLQTARQDLALEAAITKLDRYDLLVLDDLSYVRKDQAETSVLFELISRRYERRSMLITANQPFGEWNKVFPDPAMTIAAIDRLVHHSVVVEMNVDSYRQRAATTRKARTTAKPAHAHNDPPLTNTPDPKHTCRLPATIWRDNHHTKRCRSPSRLTRTPIQIVALQHEQLVSTDLADTLEICRPGGAATALCFPNLTEADRVYPRLLGLDLAVPDHSKLSRKAETLQMALPCRGAGPVCFWWIAPAETVRSWRVAAGEYGPRTRRSWRKLHIGVDTDTKRIAAATLSTSGIDDASQVGALPDQGGPLASFTADATHDERAAAP